jgi:hypothetical protein
MMERELIENSYNELIKARKVQSQILQKEFEIQLANINIKYRTYENDYKSFIDNMQKKLNAEMEIVKLKEQRNNCINLSLFAALSLGEVEVNNDRTFSNAAMIIGQISSFLEEPKMQFVPIESVKEKLSTLLSLLILNSFKYALLFKEVNRLNTVLSTLSASLTTSPSLRINPS